MNYSHKFCILLSAIAFSACSQSQFTSTDAGQTGSVSSSSSTSVSSQANLPKSTCVNSSNGGLAFKLESNLSDTFQSMRVTTFPSNPQGYVEAFTVHDNGSGTLSYELQMTEIMIDNKDDDYFYNCTVGYSEILEYANRMGISSLAAAVPRVSLDIWLTEENSTAKGKIVGLAIKNPQSKEFAVQCY